MQDKKGGGETDIESIFCTPVGPDEEGALF
ncbi:hypothetical protein GGR98_002564 [Parageobacillus caldoxylosilyticus]|nr:hypothetical protein [Parageobacillus caldoxylosilyticus]